MADLSAAQAAWFAYLDQSEIDETPDLPALAAALEAVVDQVVPYEKAPDLMSSPDLERLAQRQHTRTQLLTIAAELRGTTPTETP